MATDSEHMPPPKAPEESEEPAAMSEEEKRKIEKQQEEKLRSKYPQAHRPSLPGHGAGGGGHSAFLQKRLGKGTKYFDSGDYQMAKQKNRVPGMPGSRLAVAPGGLGMGLNIPGNPNSSTGDTIPTPDNVPARKTSIIQPLHDHSQSMHLPADPAHVGTGITPPSEPGRPLANPEIARLVE